MLAMSGEPQEVPCLPETKMLTVPLQWGSGTARTHRSPGSLTEEARPGGWRRGPEVVHKVRLAGWEVCQPGAGGPAQTQARPCLSPRTHLPPSSCATMWRSCHAEPAGLGGDPDGTRADSVTL